MGVLVFGDRTFTETFLESPSSVPVLGLANDPATAEEMLKNIETNLVAVAFPGNEGVEFTLQCADLYRNRRFFLALEPEEVTPALWSRAKAMAVTLVNRKTAVEDISRQTGISPGALTRREPVDIGEIYRAEKERAENKLLRPLPHLILAIYSPKGGAGKTAFSCNLAAAVAIWAKKEGLKDYPVVLVDTDVGGSKTARFWLGAGDVPGSLSSFADAKGPLTRNAVSSMVMRHPCGLDYVLAPRNPSEANKIDREVMAKVLTNMSRYYGLVVCDMGSSGTSLTPAAVEILQHASLILLVAEPDTPTTSDLKGFVAQAGHYHLNLAAMRLVVNKNDPKIGYSPKEMQKEIGIPLAGVIPDDINVKKLLNTGSGVLPVEKDLNSPFSRAIISLSQGVLGCEMYGVESSEGFFKKLLKRRPHFKWSL